MGATVLESCHSTWIFDTDRMRFRRILKGIEVGERTVATDWRPYARLELDPRSEIFSVWLNAEGTHLIRSWRHTAGCEQCTGQVTGPLSLDDIGDAIGV